MNTFDSITADAAQSFLDYQVVDKDNNEVGAIHSLWADDESGKLQFIGVKTGWLFGQNHVVPVEKAEIDHTNRTVQIPYESGFIKEAPSVDADAAISDEEEAEIYRYYGVKGGAARTDMTATTSATDRTERRASEATATGLAMNAAPKAATAANRTAANGDDIEVSLSEEQVKVGKRTVDAGQVRLRKIVRTEIVNQPVEIRHEDVVIERISAGQVHAGAAASDFQEETIDVPLTREEVVVSKEAHVTGAVRMHKTAETETQNVSETVRKEDVEVVRDGKTVVERNDDPSRR